MNLEETYSFIRRFEGFRAKPYLCPAGVPTIGFGSTHYTNGKKVTLKDTPITEPEAETLMESQAINFAQSVIAASPILLLPWHTLPLNAITDFAYNLGMTRYKASTLRRKIDQGEFEDAKRELIKWVWGGGKKLPGLMLRRKAEAELL